MSLKKNFGSTPSLKAKGKMPITGGNEFDNAQAGSTSTEKNKGGRPAFNPTNEQRVIVKSLAMVGVNREGIAEGIGIDADTLRKHFPEELRDARTHLLA